VVGWLDGENAGIHHGINTICQYIENRTPGVLLENRKRVLYLFILEHTQEEKNT
jgi:hypothetical protein